MAMLAQQHERNVQQLRELQLQHQQRLADSEQDAADQSNDRMNEPMGDQLESVSMTEHEYLPDSGVGAEPSDMQQPDVDNQAVSELVDNRITYVRRCSFILSPSEGSEDRTDMFKS